MVKKSFLFLDTITNKVDAKGRVSIPADYRSVLDSANSELVLYRSFTSACIEGCTADLLEKMAADIDFAFDAFSKEQEDLTALIYADSKTFGLDSTGRIMLTDKLLAHAGLTDQAVFVGKGKTFQIWEPVAFEKHQDARRQRMAQKPLSFPRNTEKAQ